LVADRRQGYQTLLNCCVPSHWHPSLYVLPAGTATSATWLKASELREVVQKFLGLSAEQMGSAQWIGHVLKQLQLVNPTRRKHHAGGQLYAIARADVLDMMRRYEVDRAEA
jgi:hypothetical protein